MSAFRRAADRGEYRQAAGTIAANEKLQFAGTVSLAPDLSRMDRIRRFLTTIGVATAHPAAFLVVGVYVAVWLALSPKSFDWTAAATVATWLMSAMEMSRFVPIGDIQDAQAAPAPRRLKARA